jgi:hypothetical protein
MRRPWKHDFVKRASQNFYDSISFALTEWIHNYVKYIHIVILFCICLGGYNTGLEARSFRVGQIPQGDEFRCLNCHFSQQGGAVNAFGYDVLLSLQNGNVNWSAVCDLDSDGDGLSNGVELGDEECMWNNGNISSDVVSNPGDPMSPPPVLPDMIMTLDQMTVDMLLDMEVDMEILPDRDLWDAWLYDADVPDAFQTQELIPDLSMIDASTLPLVDQNILLEQDLQMTQDLNINQSFDMGNNFIQVDQMEQSSPNNEKDPIISSSQTNSPSDRQSGCQNSQSHSSSSLFILLLCIFCSRFISHYT